ncbi:hypothetical protein BO71DRAFT_440034 [Aspergillus ellipticus CBS 707.79]|uniref:DUF3824 domain-containing protein n=1 Tax=Aspergillus ellipticus CBS 707.79 TaxID=1448320 RepID=A0A319DWF9_9EURO|nr:hypothetical protein BO71DRAFT_440034 [Aspergillus ellipticus CBS 707.79]
MSTYIYRERDRERDWDEPRSAVSIKRYVIPSEDDHDRDFYPRRDDPADRELVIRRTVDREEPVMVQRFERDIDYESRPYDYRSERDYYEPRGPVYLNPRESEYDIIRRSEVDREPGGYYYHRRIREYDDDRRSRREISPGDSVSQATRRRDDQEGYSSDDSMVYIRKEVREYDDPHHRRHLAEGALAGVGAAELLRNHRKKEGEDVSGGIGRLGRDVGAGALGAVAAEAVSRARDHYRSKSRHRSHSFDEYPRSHSRHHRHYHHRHGRRSRSRSRSQSHSRVRTLAELGLGAAAIAGAVALARSKSNSNKERRSRSRHRHASNSRRRSVKGTDEERSQSQRKKHMAEAGLAGAAVAGLVERARSHSRSHRRGRSRSHSTLRKALPVVAAGLGTAAATGLYEKNKEKKEEDETRRRERRRSRSRSRAASDTYPEHTRESPGLIEYGDHPVQGNIPANYYGRPVTPHGYYSDASDPVASGAAGYGSSHRPRSRSRSRSRTRGARYSSDSSDSDSGSRRRRRSRHDRHHSRSRDIAEAALAAGGVGYAAHKLSQRNERKKAERDKDRPESDDDARRGPYDGSYNNPPYAPSPAAASQQIDDHQYYPNSNFFPPPSGAAPRPEPAPYSPADYPPPPGAVPPQPYDYPARPGPNTYAPQPRRADENVSASNSPRPTAHNRILDGLEGPSPLETPRAKRRPRATSQPALPKSVAFNLHAEQERQKDLGYETDDSDSTIESIHGSRRGRPRSRRHSSSEHYSLESRRNDPYSKSRDRNHVAESDSDLTIDLPDRFDSRG